MEPNPIYWLELKQLRRGGFLYALFGAGLVMSGFRYAVIRFGIDESSASYFYMIPVLFYVLGILAAPLVAGLRFAFQQVSGDLMFDTPLCGKTIVIGKFRSALVLVLCLYLPALPGEIYRACHYYSDADHLLALASCAAVTTVFSAAAVGFAAGTKTAAGALGRIAWAAIYTGFGVALFGMTQIGIYRLLYVLNVEYHPAIMPAITVLSGVFWGGVGMLLPFWRGTLQMERRRKPGRLVAVVFALWVMTIGAAFGLAFLRWTLDSSVRGEMLTFFVFAASVFYFSCMVGEQEKKGKSIYL